MKLIQTVIVFDRGDLARSEGWATTYDRYSSVIAKMVNPPGSDRFRIRMKTRKLDAQGRPSSQWNRNAVPPIKKLFLDGMKKQGWKTECPVSPKGYLKANSDVYETHSGFRTLAEWETGNTSSSHSFLDEICSTLMAGLLDAAVLIVPSSAFCPHLAGRIGNWQDLCPYLSFLQAFGSKIVEKGLLAITVVEHDELVTDGSIPYIVVRPEGPSAKVR